MKRLNKIWRIWIDAGHGGSDPGAAAFGLIEKLINLVMAIACQKELERHGVVVGMTRLTDIYISLEDRCSMANKFLAYYVVSIHNNGGKGDRGEVIHSVNKGKGLELALKISERIKAETSQTVVKIYSKSSTKNIKKDYYTMIADTRMPSVITEGAFLDNDLDNKAIDTVAEQQAFGVAIAHGILDQIGVAIKPIIIPAIKTVTTPVTNVIYRVVTGSFTDRVNAEERIEKLKKAGFDSFIVLK